MSKTLTKQEFTDWKNQDSTRSIFSSFKAVRDRLAEMWEVEAINEENRTLEEQAFRSRLMATTSRFYRELMELDYEGYLDLVEEGKNE